jgi:hypothetical protein
MVCERALVVVVTATVVACTPAHKKEESNTVKASEVSRFFPAGALGGGESQQGYEEWFGKHLRAMKENPIHPGQQGTLVLRFLWLRTFHHPIVVRLVKTDTWHITAKQTDGQGGYEPGKITHQEDRALTKAEAEELEANLHQLGFWDFPPQQGRAGLDGAQWVLEAAEAKRYHVVNYWSPKEGPLHDFCLHLLQLTKLDIDPVY